MVHFECLFIRRDHVMYKREHYAQEIIRCIRIMYRSYMMYINIHIYIYIC